MRRGFTCACCMVVQMCVGILYLWSIFKTPVTQAFSLNDGAATMVSPVMLLCFCIGNLVGGFLQDKTNPRLIAAIGAAMFSLGVFLTSFLTPQTSWLIFATYCTLGGLGCGFTYGSILSCLQKWFPKRRGFASGLAVASFAASTVIFGPISQMLLKSKAFGENSVQYTFLTLSIVFFALSMLACLFITLPKPEITQQSTQSENQPQANQSETQFQATQPENQPQAIQQENQPHESQPAAQSIATVQRSYSPLEAMSTLPFWCIALTLFFINGTWNMVVPLIKDLGMVRGLSETAAVAAVTITGITNTLGRFSMATISDAIGRTLTVILLSVATMICALLLIFAGQYFFLIVIAVLAFCYGGPSSTLPAMTTDLYGTKYGGTNYGFAMLGLGVSSVVFNLVSIGLNNQTASFVMGAITAIISAALMLLCRSAAKKHKTKATNQ